MLQKARAGLPAFVAQRCHAGAGQTSHVHHAQSARVGRASRDPHTTTAGAGKTLYTDASGRRRDPHAWRGNPRGTSAAAGKIPCGFHATIQGVRP